MKLINNKYPIKIIIWSFLMFFLAVWGGIDNFSPVPFAGAWEGSLNFYLNVSDAKSWLMNELDHILLTTRALTWLDIRFFGGIAILLIVLCYFFLALSAVIFAYILRQKNKNKFDKEDYTLLAFLFAWLYLFMQSENYIWGHNIHTILINFLPLLTFVLLAGLKINEHSTFFFKSLLILFLSALSALTNISGLLVFPITSMYYLLIKKNIRWAILYAFFACLMFYFYLNFGTIAESSPGRIGLVLNEPLDFSHFFLTYLGNPFWHLIHLNKIGKTIALLSGILFLILFLIASFNEIKSSRKSQVDIAILFFIFFYICSVASITFGRFENGIDQALVGRYTTHAIFGWSALFLIYSPYLKNKIKKPSKGFIWLSYTLIFLMTLNQSKAMRLHNEISNKNLAGLAIVMGVNDQKLIENSVWHSSVEDIEIARNSKERGIGFVNVFPFSQVGKEVLFESNYQECDSVLQSNNVVENDSQYNFFTGIFNSTEKKEIPKFLFVYDKSEKLIGYALAGNLFKKDITTSKYGFKGYYLSQDDPDMIKIMSLNPKCQKIISLKKVRIKQS
jgi:hypothetical protein